MGLPLVFTLGILVQGSWPEWSKYSVPAGLQGRYIYPAAIGLVALAVFALKGFVPFAAQRWIAPVVVAAAVYTEWWSLHVLIREWWYSHDPGAHGCSVPGDAARDHRLGALAVRRHECPVRTHRHGVGRAARRLGPGALVGLVGLVGRDARARAGGRGRRVNAGSSTALN